MDTSPAASRGPHTTCCTASALTPHAKDCPSGNWTCDLSSHKPHPASHFVNVLGQSPFGHLGAKMSKRWLTQYINSCFPQPLVDEQELHLHTPRHIDVKVKLLNPIAAVTDHCACVLPRLLSSQLASWAWSSRGEVSWGFSPPSLLREPSGSLSRLSSTKSL